MLHAIPAGVIAVDEAGVVTQCNPEAVRLLNLSGENVGKKLMESTRDTRLCALAEDTVRENAPQSDEWTGERVLAVSGAPIRTRRRKERRRGAGHQRSDAAAQIGADALGVRVQRNA